MSEPVTVQRIPVDLGGPIPAADGEFVLPLTAELASWFHARVAGGPVPVVRVTLERVTLGSPELEYADPDYTPQTTTWFRPPPPPVVRVRFTADEVTVEDDG